MLQGKVAIVTGSTSGIGLGIARALSQEGAQVVLNGIADQATVETAKETARGKSGSRVLFHPANMTSPEQIADLVATTLAQFGHVDILVNNAGIQHTSPIEEFPADKWDAIVAINLTSAFHTIRACLPAMRRSGWGRIINIASVHGLVASEEKSAYVAAKHGLVGLTKVVALETARSGITCNAVCPGWVRTPLVETQISALAAKRNLSVEQAALELLGQKQPSGRFVEVDELGQLIVFLCSAGAASITGASLPLDGAWTAC